MSVWLSFIISYTDKHEFSSLRKWISCCNDIMNHTDCVIKYDVYPQKMHSVVRAISPLPQCFQKTCTADM